MPKNNFTDFGSELAFIDASRSLVMFIIVIDAVNSLEANNSFGKVDLKNALSHAKNTCEEAVNFWPVPVSKEFIIAHRGTFARFLEETHQEDFYDAEVVYIMHLIAADLQMINKTGVRKDYSDILMSYVQKLVDHIDINGAHIPAMDKASKILANLYEIIGLENV